jgi:hypothetical protein
MAEPVYNVFLLFNADVCSSVGYVVHEHLQDDAVSMEFLKAQVVADFKRAIHFDLSKPFTRDEYNARCRLGQSTFHLEQLIRHLKAPRTPLLCVTPVKDGSIYFNYSFHSGEMDTNAAARALGHTGTMIDWLEKYTDEEGNTHLSRLIQDDYFRAIDLTFNARLYVSSMKLLLCCIDSLAYVEYGNDRKTVPFINWLSVYADLAPLGITAEELWELRNGLLHMTNISSAKVRKRKVRRISFKIGQPIHPGSQTEIFYFDFVALIRAVSAAHVRWLDTYNGNFDKLAAFVERYDETISDNRVATHIEFTQTDCP